MQNDFINLSLILFAPNENTDSQIKQSLSSLAKIRCRTEIILVADRPIDADPVLTDAITYRPTPKVFPCLSEALLAAKHPLIGVLDSKAKIEPAITKYLCQRVEENPIQTAFHSTPAKIGKLKTLTLWLYSLLVRVLLRTWKSELRPGFALFHKSAIAPSLRGKLEQQKVVSVTQLLSIARLNGQPVNEVNLGIADDEDSTALTPNSRTIRRATSQTVRYWWNTIMFPRQRYELTQASPGKKTKTATQIAISIGLLIVGAFVLMGSLEFPLFEPDEARNSQLALNIVESGEWLSLSLADDFYWDKPPLQIWMIAASYKMFGVSQFATRLPGTIASLLTILLMLVAGKRLVGFRSAAIGTAMLLLSSGFVVISRYVTMDASLTCAATATLILGYVAIRDRFEKGTAILAGIACGFGLLIKGPVIGVICFPPLLAAAWLLAKEPHQIKTKNRWLWFLIPMGLIATPWFIAMTLVHPDFLSYFFWTHHVVRFSNAFNHHEPLWYYAIGIFLFMFPASYLLPSVAKFSTSRKPENRLWRTKEHGFLFLAAVWILAFFSISQSKLPTYIAPAFPLICLMMGVLLNRKILQSSSSIVQPTPITNETTILAVSQPVKRRRTFLERLPRHAPIELLFWIFACSAAILFIFRANVASIPVMILSVLLIVPLGILASRKRSKPKVAWSAFGLLGLFMVVLLSHQLIPALSKARSVQIAASELQSSNQEFANSPVVYFGEKPYGALLTQNLNAIYFDWHDTKNLVEYLKWNPNSIIVSSKEPMEHLRIELPWTVLITQQEDKRHLYVTRPNEIAIAREQQSQLFR